MMVLDRENLLKIYQELLSENEEMLPLSKMTSLLCKCKLPCDAKDVVLSLAGLRHLNSSNEEQTHLPFNLFYRWYCIERKSGLFAKNNHLLIRNKVSRVRLPTRNIREASFTYGTPSKYSETGVGAALSDWTKTKKDKVKLSGICLIKVNKAALKENITTPRDFVQFFKKHKHEPRFRKQLRKGRNRKLLQRQQRLNQKDCGSALNSNKRLKVKTEIYSPLDTQSERNYVDKSGQTRKGKLPFPKQTKNTILQKKYCDSKLNPSATAQDTNWKLTKFKSVASKVKFT